MATGRIGVTPTLGVRWSKAPAGGTTSLSGLDDNSVSLVYSVGYEQVYRNGVLLSRGNDYTATNGTSITLIDATITGDIIEVFAQELVPLTDAISKGQFTAKGSLLSASAASTPGVLAVGSNDQVLTADSTTTTGLKWATPTSGGMTLLNSGGTTLSGSTTTISFTSTGYTALRIYIKGAYETTSAANVLMRINGDTGSNYSYAHTRNGGSVNNVNTTSLAYIFNSLPTSNSDVKLVGNAQIDMFFPTDTDYITTVWSSIGGASDSFYFSTGVSTYDSTAAVSSITFLTSSGNFSGGTIYVYGVK